MANGIGSYHKKHMKSCKYSPSKNSIGQSQKTSRKTSKTRRKDIVSENIPLSNRKREMKQSIPRVLGAQKQKQARYFEDKKDKMNKNVFELK